MAFHAGRPDVECLAGRRATSQGRRQVNVESRLGGVVECQVSAAAREGNDSIRTGPREWISRDRHVEVSVAVGVSLDLARDWVINAVRRLDERVIDGYDGVSVRVPRRSDGV